MDDPTAPPNIHKVDELLRQLRQFARLFCDDDPHSLQWNTMAELFTDLSFRETKEEVPA